MVIERCDMDLKSGETNLDFYRNQLKLICAKLTEFGEESLFLTVNISLNSSKYIASPAGLKFLFEKTEGLDQFFKLCQDIHSSNLEKRISGKERSCINKNENTENISIESVNCSGSKDTNDVGKSNDHMKQTSDSNDEENEVIEFEDENMENKSIARPPGLSGKSPSCENKTRNLSVSDVTLKKQSGEQQEVQDKAYIGNESKIGNQKGSRRSEEKTFQRKRKKPKQEFPCNICGNKVYKSSKGLREHLFAAHKIKCSICDVCGKMFKATNYLLFHKRKNCTRTHNSCSQIEDGQVIIQGAKTVNQKIQGDKTVNQNIQGGKSVNQNIQGAKTVNQKIQGDKPVNQKIQGDKPVNQKIQCDKTVNQKIQGIKYDQTVNNMTCSNSILNSQKVGTKLSKLETNKESLIQLPDSSIDEKGKTALEPNKNGKSVLKLYACEICKMKFLQKMNLKSHLLTHEIFKRINDEAKQKILMRMMSKYDDKSVATVSKDVPKDQESDKTEVRIETSFCSLKAPDSGLSSEMQQFQNIKLTSIARNVQPQELEINSCVAGKNIQISSVKSLLTSEGIKISGENSCLSDMQRKSLEFNAHSSDMQKQTSKVTLCFTDMQTQTPKPNPCSLNIKDHSSEVDACSTNVQRQTSEASPCSVNVLSQPSESTNGQTQTSEVIPYAAKVQNGTSQINQCSTNVQSQTSELNIKSTSIKGQLPKVTKCLTNMHNAFSVKSSSTDAQNLSLSAVTETDRVNAVWFSCEICHSVFIAKKSLSQHLRITHGIRKGPGIEPPVKTQFTCIKCGKSFRKSKYLSDHLLTIHLEKCSICRFCGKLFDSQKNLRAHIEKHKYGNYKEKLQNIEKGEIIHEPFDRMNDRSVKTSVKGIEETFRKDTEGINVEAKNKAPEKKMISLLSGNKVSQISSEEEETIKKNSFNQRAFKCDICLLEYRSKSSLLDHIARKHDQGTTFDEINGSVKFSDNTKASSKYVCPYCNIGYRFTGYLREHLITAHNDDSVICKICGKLFDSRKKLKAHICPKGQNYVKKFSVHGEKMAAKSYSCDNCEDGFHTEQELLKHKRKHTADILYTCTHCGKVFLKTVGLRTHMIAVHQDKKSICRICGALFQTVALMRIHLDDHDLNDPNTCDLCGKKFSTIEELDTHKQSHSEPKFICDYCGKSYKSHGSLALHRKTHQGTFPFECNICNKTFVNASKYKGHKFTHATSKRFQCEFCGCAFKSPNSLINHRNRVHLFNKRRLQKCLFCPHTFKEEIYKLQHMLSHHFDSLDMSKFKDKVHQCKFCDKMFASFYLHKRHLRSHAGNHSCSCDICGKSFSSRPVLKNHLLVHSSSQLYKCDICKIDLNDKNELNKHLKSCLHEKNYEKQKGSSVDITLIETSHSELEENRELTTDYMDSKMDIDNDRHSKSASFPNNSEETYDEMDFLYDVTTRSAIQSIPYTYTL